MAVGHWWFNGRILASHAGDPGSIPGQCRLYLLFLPPSPAHPTLGPSLWSSQGNQVFSTFWSLGKATTVKINAICIHHPKLVSPVQDVEEHTWWIWLLSPLLHIGLENQWWLSFFLSFFWRMPGNQFPVFKDSLPGPCTGPWATLSTGKRTRKEIPKGRGPVSRKHGHWWAWL